MEINSDETLTAIENLKRDKDRARLLARAIALDAEDPRARKVRNALEAGDADGARSALRVLLGRDGPIDYYHEDAFKSSGRQFVAQLIRAAAAAARAEVR